MSRRRFRLIGLGLAAGALSATTLTVGCSADDGGIPSYQGAGGTGGTVSSGGGGWPSAGGTGPSEGGTSPAAGGAGATDDAGPSGGTGGATGGAAGAAGATGGAGGAAPVDCSGIDTHPELELCGSGTDYCEGVFTNYNGCVAFCAAAGLTCASRYGGQPGCQGPELQFPLDCSANTGHQSDWCRCERASGGTGGSAGSGTGGAGGSPACPVDPGAPPTYRVLGYMEADYVPRSSWVLECRDYAYTAYFVEHEACDSEYQSGSGAGTATFTIGNVPAGMYDVYFEGMHTDNRNPEGALVIVSSGGQSWPKRIMQKDATGAIIKDFHGTYCLSGTVTVVLDSSTWASDSVQHVYLEP